MLYSLQLKKSKHRLWQRDGYYRVSPSGGQQTRFALRNSDFSFRKRDRLFFI